MKYEVNVLDERCCDVFKCVDTISIIKGDDTYVYNNVHNVSMGTVVVSQGVVQNRSVYFRSYKEVEGGRQFSSHVLELFNSCTVDIYDNVVTIVANGMFNNGVDFLLLKSWFRPNPTFSSRSRVTKDVAQSRLDALGFNFTVTMWENTSSPATVKCNTCSSEIMFKKGSSIYSVSDFGGFSGICGVCQRYKYALENIGKYKTKLVVIESKFANAVYDEDEFLQLKLSIEDKIKKEEGIIQSYREINPYA